ncbi:MAG: hypothetical protein J7K73_03075 [Nanoarchaeota archaeon]|nr:hypothetical protein [Nanoarchaeota archaeon]
MPLKPYHTFREAREIAGEQRFNPKSPTYIEATSAYSAAYHYFKKHGGEAAVNILDGVIRDKYRGKPITEDDLIDIAREMQRRGVYFIREDIRNRWVTEITQIVNARRGNGNPLVGYIMSFSGAYA